MIHFFRRIRQQLLSQNRFSKYLLYAVGEILLVVVGILIALKVSNWNINKKNDELRTQYVNSLITDLVKDSTELTGQIQVMKKDYELMRSFSNRLSKVGATIDTLIQISRYEFSGRFSPNNILNQNTINSLISSAQISLFDIEFRDQLLEHKKNQETALNVINDNFQIYFQTLFLNKRAPVDRDNRLTSAINGPLLDQMWNNFDMDDHLYSFNKVLTNKLVMEEIVVEVRSWLLSKTNEYLKSLRTDLTY